MNLAAAQKELDAQLGAMVRASVRVDQQMEYLAHQLRCVADSAHLCNVEQGRSAGPQVIDRLPNSSQLREKVDQLMKKPDIAARLASLEPQHKFMARWAVLLSQAEGLGLERNERVHGNIMFGAQGAIRQNGPVLWGKLTQVDPVAEGRLIKRLNDLWSDLGQFTTQLSYALPFADPNKVLTLTMTDSPAAAP